VELYLLAAVGVAVVGAAVISRLIAGRRLKKHLDAMQAAEAAKAEARRHSQHVRRTPGN
jgi:hypothetical protein